ncbi:hypothetical protein B484DRAFT_447980 [Ochromonadaceae sp. CCMP2298]|nr:hypothetical protein B484DRAFT_447980 [Ochromonadaceae sp. CCMP2298]
MKLVLLLLLVALLGAEGWRADSWKLQIAEDTSFTKKMEYLAEVTAMTSDLEHTGAETFDEHLLGVQAILRRWGADEAVADAGLFHSIYGTEGFQGFKLPLSSRLHMQGLLGARAERLAWIFCMVDRSTVDASLYASYGTGDSAYTFTSRAELGRFPIHLSGESEWLDFIELSLADWLEQVEGAATKENPLFRWKVGEAWAYRRQAYHKMAQILQIRGSEDARLRRTVATKMLEEIFGEEPQDTRHLHQERTPPVSEAAKDAQEALRSALLEGEEGGGDWEEAWAVGGEMGVRVEEVGVGAGGEEA